MKILIFGPKARYDLYLPEFVRDLPVEPVFCGAPAPSSGRRRTTRTRR